MKRISLKRVRVLEKLDILPLEEFAGESDSPPGPTDPIYNGCEWLYYYLAGPRNRFGWCASKHGNL